MATIITPISHAPGRRDRNSLLAAAAMALWTACVLLGRSGAVPRLTPYASMLMVLGPAVGVVLVVLRRTPAPEWFKWSVGWMVAVSVIAFLSVAAGSQPLLALGPAALVVASVATRRRPEYVVVIIAVLSGAGPLIQLYTGVTPGPIVDLSIIALWAGFLWSRSFGDGTHLPRPLHWGVYLWLAYIAVSAIFALTGENTPQAIFGFRAMAWYMLSAVGVYLVMGDERSQRIALKGFLLAGLFVGTYSMLRWVTGVPAREDLAIRSAGGTYVLDKPGGSPKLSGPLLNPDELGVWSAWMVGFAGAFALSPVFGHRWRAIAAVTTLFSGAALAGADTRVAILGAAAGCVAALILFGVARGFSSRRVVPLTIGLALAIIGTGAFVTIQLADETSRFRGLLDPTNDFSYQDRVNKWKTVLSDMPTHPFGHGLGTTGIGELRYARFRTNATFDPDSSYVKVAYDQGYVVMGLFIAAILALLLALLLRALSTADPWDATRAIAGFAALSSFAVAMSAGIYNEGLIAFAVWLAAMLGLAPRSVPSGPPVPSGATDTDP